MHENMKCQLLVLLYAIVSVQAYRSYNGYQVLRTENLNATTVIQLSSWLQRHPEFDTWSPARVTMSADIMTSPEHVSHLRQVLDMMDIKYSVHVHDVGHNIAKEKALNEKIKREEQNKNLRAPSFERFLTYDEIQTYLDEVASSYNNIATLIDIGTSYEGRPMRVLKLSNGIGKTGIWFDAAIHAREWAAPPVALYAINELTENLVNNQAMLDKNDFYFLPVANPDGYSYTWTDDRFWRKTRSPNSVCVGTDANRNFDSHWGEGGDGPCSDTYPGSSVFSEPEIKAMSDFLLNETSITFYTALHSYGQLILSPYSYTINHPVNYDQMVNLPFILIYRKVGKEWSYD